MKASPGRVQQATRPEMAQSLSCFILKRDSSVTGAKGTKRAGSGEFVGLDQAGH